jgi:hypothetical protein
LNNLEELYLRNFCFGNFNLPASHSSLPTLRKLTLHFQSDSPDEDNLYAVLAAYFPHLEDLIIQYLDSGKLLHIKYNHI